MQMTTPIGFNGLLMQSGENRSSLGQGKVQKCLCYCKSNMRTSLTLTTTSKRN